MQDIDHKVERNDTSNCLFCKIAAGVLPSKKVYEDDNFYAFYDIHPKAPVHVLVIPRKHIESLSDCGENESVLLGKLFILIPQLAKQLGIAYIPSKDPEEAENNTTGFRTTIHTGPGGGQEIFHLHAHIMGSPS
jgi:histidine triad (HIT) family protein